MSAARPLRSDQTALVLIDLQEKLAPAIDRIEPLLANVCKLLHLAKVLDLPIFLTTQYQKGLGPVVPAILGEAGVQPIDKVSFNCLDNDGFRAHLLESFPPAGTLLLAGVETHICVMQTALGALAESYDVHVISDAAGARSAVNHAVGLERMRAAGCVISSAEMAIYELLGVAGGEEFRNMLPLLK